MNGKAMADQVEQHVELTKKESCQAEGFESGAHVSLILSVLAGVVIYVVFF